MRPDAIIIPKSCESGADANARKESILDVAEPLLELGPHELAWCRDQATYYFCTRDTSDTELHPSWHPRSGQARYEWRPGADGVKLGFLLACEG